MLNHRPPVHIALAFALFAMSCATTTKITTDTPGATVIHEKDGKELGKTPLEVKTSMWLWESERYIVKRGGASKVVEVKRSDVDVLPMVGGVCLTATLCGAVVGIPLILAGGMKTPPETKVKLETKSAKRPSDTVAVRY